MKLVQNEQLGAALRVLDRNGDPWFVAKDVCAALEIQNTSDALKRLDEDEKGIDLIDTLGGRQNVSIVSESGLYALILRSDKPAAKAFRRWVTSEVLPEIRRTGSYGGIGPSLESRQAVKRLREAQEEMKQIQARMEGLRMEAAREIAESLGLEVEFRIPGQGEGALALPAPEPKRGQWTKQRRRRSCRAIDYPALAAEIPCPMAYREAVEWLMERHDLTANNARTRLHRLEKRRLLVRRGQKLFCPRINPLKKQ